MSQSKRSAKKQRRKPEPIGIRTWWLAGVVALSVGGLSLYVAHGDAASDAVPAVESGPQKAQGPDIPSLDLVAAVETEQTFTEDSAQGTEVPFKFWGEQERLAYFTDETRTARRDAVTSVLTPVVTIQSETAKLEDEALADEAKAIAVSQLIDMGLEAALTPVLTFVQNGNAHLLKAKSIQRLGLQQNLTSVQILEEVLESTQADAEQTTVALLALGLLGSDYTPVLPGGIRGRKPNPPSQALKDRILLTLQGILSNELSSEDRKKVAQSTIDQVNFVHSSRSDLGWP